MLPTLAFWPEEFHGLYSPWGCRELDMTERLSLSLPFSFMGNFSISMQSQLMVFNLLPSKSHLDSFMFYLSACYSDGEGNGTPLQYSCLENPMDGGAW